MHREIIEVPEDSEDAKKWPLWTADDTEEPHGDASASNLAQPPQAKDSIPVSAVSNPAKKPMRRKSRVQLAEIPSASSQKAKKLTTLEKSAMDWQEHVASQPNAKLQDELDANRRGGGYLDKMRFLNDVGDRRDKLLEDSKSGKRRRG